ncbi:MAG: LysE family translocator [Erythrobacter sp.]
MDIIGFALAVLLIELTPGPNMAWLAGLGATQGKRVGHAAVAGVALGLLVNGVLAALGLAALLQAAPWLWHVLQWSGAAMMVFLAIETWRGAGRGAGRGRLPRLGEDGEDREHTGRRAFLTGALINLLNPKAYVFFVAVAPRFLDGEGLSLGNALVLAVVSASIATIIHLTIVHIGARAQAWLADPHRMQIARRGFALVMLGVAVSFVVADLT